MGYLLRSLKLFFVQKFSDFNLRQKNVELPVIDIAFVVGVSDFDIAKEVIDRNISRCMNPIRNVVIIAQNDKFSYSANQVTVISRVESELVSGEQIQALRQKFGSRSGWVIQQALKCHIAATASISTAIIDADTVFQSDFSLVNRNGLPVVPCIPSRNPAYDKALRKVGVVKKFLDFSHVMHFIVISPGPVKRILTDLGLHPIDKFIDTISRSGGQGFSFDYELLGELMKKSKKRALVKVKNTDGQRKNIYDTDPRFDSISFHHYVQS